ncbi:gamma-glutamyltranspeptidase [Klebsiella michiganensis]|uniref:Gamma-glutamyltranspeptidase n=1 Tax=Klebsiella michiganensis TaxID=1134687 RepID=A0A7H4LVG8_9ENTR|nr:gamma-glutamyltranspeptidase [Klebsiella michiganensis]
MADADDAMTVHRIVEATKLAFGLRDAHITDPRHLDVDIQSLLTPAALQPLAENIDDQRAARGARAKARATPYGWGLSIKAGWRSPLSKACTTSSAAAWCCRKAALSGRTAGHRSASTPRHLLALAPGKQPFHTLNPAAARLNDGRVMVYGSMGGDGQPQTQAAIFTRYVMQNVPLQESITRPRWLLGRTWGQTSDSLKLEGRFSAESVARLRQLGTTLTCWPILAKPWATPGRLFAIPTACLRGPAIRAATAPPPAIRS